MTSEALVRHCATHLCFQLMQNSKENITLSWNVVSIYVTGLKETQTVKELEKKIIVRILTSSTLWNHPDSFPLRFPAARKVHPLQAEGMGSLPVVLLLCSFQGNVTKQDTQINLFNYGWVAVCLLLCCKPLPSCGFCSTALTVIAQTQPTGKALLLLIMMTDVCYSLSFSHLFFFFSFLTSRSTWERHTNWWVSPLLGLLWFTQYQHDMCLRCYHSAECREETYPCTRMYSVHKPIKRCIGSLCLYRWSANPLQHTCN